MKQPRPEQVARYRKLVLTEKIKVIKLIHNELACDLREARNYADTLYEEEEKKRQAIQRQNQALNDWAKKRFFC